MLILTRRIDEEIIIGDDIRVVILGFRGNQIRVGIAAPDHIEVHRKEIYDRIQAEHAAKPSENKSDGRMVEINITS